MSPRKPKPMTDPKGEGLADDLIGSDPEPADGWRRFNRDGERVDADGHRIDDAGKRID